MTRESPIHAAAYDPAVAIIQSLKVVRKTRECAADIVFVSSQCDARFGVKQDTVEGVADPPGHARKKVGVRLYDPDVGIAERQPDGRAAFHGGARGRAFDTNHHEGSKLIVATNLPADHGAGRRGACGGDAGCRTGEDK